MRGIRTTVLVALAIVTLVLAPQAAARQTTTKTLPVFPGIFFKANPCAVGGQGEDVELTAGSIDLTTDGEGVTRKVRYNDVSGIGLTTGLTYEISYLEEHPSETRLIAYLTMTSEDSTFVEWTLIRNGVPAVKSRCR